MTGPPHASWAEVYDLAYQETFGTFYTRLTEATLGTVENLVQPPARIVDFGAGTGRLAIPLAEKGFFLTAVDPCWEMLDQMQKKARQGKIKDKLTVVCSRMENFACKPIFDLALCVFTVICYLLDKERLKKALAAAHASLKPGGVLIIDIPSKEIFCDVRCSSDSIKRSVSVTESASENIFIYREELKVKRGKNWKAYQDEFKIRYWHEAELSALLEDIGFTSGENLPVCNSFGANYYKYLKGTE